MAATRRERRPARKETKADREDRVSPERLTFGANLLRAREAAGMTQRDLTEITGYHQSWLSQVERGVTNISLDTMVNLAKAVGRPLHLLVRPGPPAQRVQPATSARRKPAARAVQKPSARTRRR